MDNQEILNSIVNSKWYGISDYCRQFYQPSKIKYGIYVSGLERFILVDGLDLWSTMYAAKLLSSKFHSLVFPIDGNIDIELHTCLNFKPINNSDFPYEGQPPVLKDRITTETIQKLGPPKNQDLKKLIHDQEFCLFVLRISQAIKIIEGMFSNTNHRFYKNFFPESVTQYLKHGEDESMVGDGFVMEIEKLLYYSTSIDEAKKQIDLIFTENKKRPYSMKRYTALFNRLLDYDKR